jgi:hypothetical protein
MEVELRGVGYNGMFFFKNINIQETANTDFNVRNSNNFPLKRLAEALLRRC